MSVGAVWQGDSEFNLNQLEFRFRGASIAQGSNLITYVSRFCQNFNFQVSRLF